jgi:hypothetical protein
LFGDRAQKRRALAMNGRPGIIICKDFH